MQVRVGEPTVHKFGLENLFYKYGVFRACVCAYADLLVNHDSGMTVFILPFLQEWTLSCGVMSTSTNDFGLSTTSQ